MVCLPIHLVDFYMVNVGKVDIPLIYHTWILWVWACIRNRRDYSEKEPSQHGNLPGAKDGESSLKPCSKGLDKQQA